MEYIYERYGPAFAIIGKSMGWHIGRWKPHGYMVMLKPINDTDFVFCTLTPQTDHQFDPLFGIMEQTWYVSLASLDGKPIEISKQGVQVLIETNFQSAKLLEEKL